MPIEILVYVIFMYVSLALALMSNIAWLVFFKGYRTTVKKHLKKGDTPHE